MADLSITAANVKSSGGSKGKNGTAGAAVKAGELVYLEASSGTYKLASSNSGTAEARSPDGIALNNAAAGQPLRVHTEGPITIGATLTAGVAYYASGTAGGICPVADLTTGHYPTIVGIAKSSSVLDVKFHESGVAL